jgi:hypothetical protein
MYILSATLYNGKPSSVSPYLNLLKSKSKLNEDGGIVPVLSNKNCKNSFCKELL